MTEAHTICKKIDATYYLVGDQSIIQKKSKRHSVIDCAYECWHKQEALSLLAGTFLDIINQGGSETTLTGLATAKSGFIHPPMQNSMENKMRLPLEL